MWQQQREALVAFINARFDDDEYDANQMPTDIDIYAAMQPVAVQGRGMEMVLRRISSRERLLRDVESKRRILAEVVEQIDDMDSRIEGEWGSGHKTTGESDLLLMLLALPYSEHPEYDAEAWKPEQRN